MAVMAAHIRICECMKRLRVVDKRLGRDLASFAPGRRHLKTPYVDVFYLARTPAGPGSRGLGDRARGVGKRGVGLASGPSGAPAGARPLGAARRRGRTQLA